VEALFFPTRRSLKNKKKSRDKRERRVVQTNLRRRKIGLIGERGGERSNSFLQKFDRVHEVKSSLPESRFYPDCLKLCALLLPGLVGILP